MRQGPDSVVGVFIVSYEHLGEYLEGQAVEGLALCHALRHRPDLTWEDTQERHEKTYTAPQKEALARSARIAMALPAKLFAGNPVNGHDR